MCVCMCVYMHVFVCVCVCVCVWADRLGNSVSAEWFGWMLSFLWAIWLWPKLITNSLTDGEAAVTSQIAAHAAQRRDVLLEQLISKNSCTEMDPIVHKLYLSCYWRLMKKLNGVK